MRKKTHSMVIAGPSGEEKRVVGKTTQDKSPKYFRLTGLIGNQYVSFDLSDGYYSIGSLVERDIYLPGKGVSRDHARLRIRGNTVVLQDVGSKNGVFVDGQRIGEERIWPGATLAFGSVGLLLLELDPSEAKLAISLERRIAKTVQDGERTETRTQPKRQSDEFPAWIPHLKMLAGYLLGSETPNPARALGMLKEALSASGIALISLESKNEPEVLSSIGEIPEPSHSLLQMLKEARLDQGDAGGILCSKIEDDVPQNAWALALPSEGAPIALIVSGSYPHRTASGPLLEITLQMLMHCQYRPIHLENQIRRNESSKLNFPPGFVVGSSKRIQTVYEQMRQLLRGDLPVLIIGETGVGKEVFAKILHRSCTRKDGPFVDINCAAIPSDLLEAELFGIEKGVATGVAPRPGKFATAEGGVVFLDEIADMSPDLQAKLLRALQEMEITPVGARRPIPINVRIISATNAKLENKMREGSFRRDLYYRIAGFSLNIPALRERRDDIPLLVEHFMRQYAAEISKSIRGITVGALKTLQNARWAGNIRELEHEVRYLVYICPENHLAKLEKRLITTALVRTRNNRSKAAKLLGISRNGLALKMDRLGIEG